ncbi:MAG: branched-chain amino acid ABC transporter permease [Candidatus Bathyarchaeia archaeon]
MAFSFYFFIYLALSQMWNLLAGYAKLFSLGPQAFIGLSVYMFTVALNYWRWILPTSLLIACLFAVVSAVAISFLIFRMKGIYFAVGTLLFSEILRIWFTTWGYTRGTYGISLNLTLPFQYIYCLSVGVGALSTTIIWIISESNFGLSLKAIGDDEDLAQHMGVHVFKYKLACFIISTLMTGLAGCIYYLYPSYVHPNSVFNILWLFIASVATFVGGVRTVEGPIIGSFILVLLRQWLIDYPGLGYLLFGLMLVVIVAIFPKGIIEFLRRFLRR